MNNNIYIVLYIPCTAERVVAACALAKAGYSHLGKSKLSKQFELHHYNKGIYHPETLKSEEKIKIMCLQLCIQELPRNLALLIGHIWPWRAHRQRRPFPQCMG